jgi:hypothetical protein
MEGLTSVNDVTPETIAQWMAARLEEHKRLYQADVVGDIAATFGDDFTYLNDNGNPAIDKRILRAFRKITQVTPWSGTDGTSAGAKGRRATHLAASRNDVRPGTAQAC